MGTVKMPERRELRDIVSPVLCQQLLELGVPNIGRQHWLYHEHQWHLWSYVFDPDGVYEMSDEVIYNLNPSRRPEKAIVAFTTGDMLAALPDLIITTDAGDVEVGIDQLYGNISIRDSRLPDALARVLISLLQGGRYRVDYVTSKVCAE